MTRFSLTKIALITVAAAVVVSTAFAIEASSSSSPPKSALGGTPCNCTLTPADLAAQGQQDAAFFARRAAFITFFAATKFDPSTLPRFEVAASLAPPPQTLQLASAKATAIVEGTVNALHFSPSGTTADVLVTAVGKGAVASGDVLSVQVGMQLEPNQTFSGAELGIAPGSPVLLPGQQAMFLLSQSDGGWSAESGAQAFPVTNGVVSVADSSIPFSSQINGLTPTAFLGAAK